MYYVYIIYSKKLREKYIGYTGNIKERLEYHNTGKCKYTRRGIPWRLIYCEIFISERDARAEEKFLKSGKGRERLKFLLPDTTTRLQLR